MNFSSFVVRLSSFVFILLSTMNYQLSTSFAEGDRYSVASLEKSFLAGRYERAAYEADRLIDARVSNRADIYYLKGLSELKLNRFELARKSFQVILNRYSGSQRAFDACVGIGDSYFLEGNTDRAIATYKDVLEKYPGNSNVSIASQRLNKCFQKNASG